MDTSLNCSFPRCELRPPGLHKMDESLSDPHAMIHRNICLLMTFKKTDAEFKRLFKQGMFKVPNKSGFMHVVNFLNCIIHKEQWKSITNWPILANKDEMKFRMAVRLFTSNINSRFSKPIVPVLVPSNLMAPGGHQVACFVWKLSQFALSEFMEREWGMDLDFARNVDVNPKLLNCKIKATQAMSIGNVDRLVSRQLAHTQYVKHALEKTRNMEKEMIKKIKEEELKLKDLISSLSLLSLGSDVVKRKLETANRDREIETWTHELDDRVNSIANRHSELVLLEEPVDRCFQLVKDLVEHNGSQYTLDGLELFKAHPSAKEGLFSGNNELLLHAVFTICSNTMVKVMAKVKQIIPADLSPYIRPLSKIQSDLALCCSRSDIISDDISQRIVEYEKSRKESEEIEFELETRYVPQVIEDYTATPPLNLRNPTEPARVPTYVPPKDGDSFLNYVRKALFEEKSKTAEDSKKTFPLQISNKRTDNKSNIPKLIYSKKKNVEENNEFSPKLSGRKPKRNRILKDRFLSNTPKSKVGFGTSTPSTANAFQISATRTQTPKKQARISEELLENEENIILPHDLSVSTASPCSSVGTPHRFWQLSGTPQGTPDNSDAHRSSQSFNKSTLPSTSKLCHSSPSGMISLPTEEENSSHVRPKQKIRRSLEGIIQRYNNLRKKLNTPAIADVDVEPVNPFECNDSYKSDLFLISSETELLSSETGEDVLVDISFS